MTSPNCEEPSEGEEEEDEGEEEEAGGGVEEVVDKEGRDVEKYRGVVRVGKVVLRVVLRVVVKAFISI